MAIFSRTIIFFKNAKTVYKNFIIRKPYLSQAIQVSIIMGSGDLFAQKVVEGKLIKDIDIYRTFKYAGLGLCFIGPSLRLWYGQLDKLTKNQTQRWKIATIKVALDQLLFAPVFLALITIAISVLQGMEFENIIQRMKNDYGTLLKSNYCIWPMVQVLNFSVIPLHYQVIFVQIAALIWNTYLSVKLK